MRHEAISHGCGRKVCRFDSALSRTNQSACSLESLKETLINNIDAPGISALLSLGYLSVVLHSVPGRRRTALPRPVCSRTLLH